MAETTLNVQQVGTAGTALALANADTTNGNKFSNDGNAYLYMYNAAAVNSAIVTIATGKTIGGHTVSDQAITLAATARMIAGPFDKDLWNQPSGDDVNCIIMTITGDGAADVDLAVFQ